MKLVLMGFHKKLVAFCTKFRNLGEDKIQSSFQNIVFCLTRWIKLDPVIITVIYQHQNPYNLTVNAYE
jgi:hypothetical protein